ncbi:hypothetical protein QCA50_011045 [Cerrena zonata]|uniref:DUF7330 domain-containing protein n=1 Tax=Cerrena zonata TaxID=2478898 RepID=A0AAW0FXR0_9APHY
MLILHEKDAYAPSSVSKSVADSKDFENPPPYVAPSPSSSSPRQINPLNIESQIPTSLFQSAVEQQTNHLYLQSRHNPISGSYIINSEIPPFAVGCKATKDQGRVPLDRQNSKYFKKCHTSNAQFETRHGAITLNLATAGTDDTKLTRTYVQASSRHAKININLFSLQMNKHICLEAATRHGHIVVFLPQTFQGLIQIRSRRGNVNFLPSFAQHARVVNGSDTSAMVLFGVQNIVLSDLDNDDTDLCMLTTRHGKITIGISGVDTYDDSQSTNLLVKKIGSLSMMLLGTDVTR